MFDLLELAQTKDEYTLALAVLNSLLASTGGDFKSLLNIEEGLKNEISTLIEMHLAAFRALPRSVDSYLEDQPCSTGQIPPPPTS